MRHASIEELLRRRDGEVLSPEIDRHVEHCPDCRNELQRLHQTRAHLRALPRHSPPRDRWPAVRDAVIANQRDQKRRWAFRAMVAAAALILATLGVQVARQRHALELERSELRATLAVLMEHSQLLEAELQSVRAGSRVQSGWRAQAIVELEDLLSEVDTDLGRALELASGEPTSDAIELWRDRLEIQDALLRVHVEPVSHRGI